MKTFVVLGMHRSATSLAAKGLYENNVHMGDVLLGAHESNKYGHFENVDFIRMNDLILRISGGSWKRPPSRDKILKAGGFVAKDIAALIKRSERAPFWGWKDPRTTLTIECYLPFLTSPHFVCCFREKSDVANSLNKRDEMPLNLGARLAEIYNQRLTEFLTRWYQ